MRELIEILDEINEYSYVYEHDNYVILIDKDDVNTFCFCELTEKQWSRIKSAVKTCLYTSEFSNEYGSVELELDVAGVSVAVLFSYSLTNVIKCIIEFTDEYSNLYRVNMDSEFIMSANSQRNSN